MSESAIYHIKVHWHHDNPDEPNLLYSEVEDDGYESRKVEEHRSGRLDFAESDRSSGDTRLGELPVPNMEEISKQGEFTPSLITKKEFEEIWKKANPENRKT